SDGYVVARQIDLLKSIDFLEVGKTVPMFFSVRKTLIDEIGNAALSARLHGMSDQCIRRSLILVLNHGNNVHETSLSLGCVGNEFCKTDQFVAKKRTDENAAFKKCCRFLAHLLAIFPEMSVAFALAHAGFVIDFPNSFSQLLIESDFTKSDAAFLSLACPVARQRAYLLVPPMVEGRYRQH